MAEKIDRESRAETAREARLASFEKADALQNAEIQAMMQEFIDISVAQAFTEATQSHDFTSESYRLPDNWNVQKQADLGHLTLDFNADGTYTITSTTTGEQSEIIGKTPELIKAEQLGISVSDYQKMVTYSDTLSSLSDELSTFDSSDVGISYLKENAEIAAMLYMLTDGETKIGYTTEQTLSAIKDELGETLSFFSENSEAVSTYHQEGVGVKVGEVLGSISQAQIQGMEEYGKKLAEIGFTTLITGGLVSLAEGGILLAASEGYIAADTARTINDVYVVSNTIQDIVDISESIEAGNISEIIGSKYFDIGVEGLNIDQEITDTITSLNNLYIDMQAFETGDLEKKLSIAGEYVNIPASTFTPEFISEGGVDFLIDMDKWASDLGIEGLDIDLSGLDLSGIDMSGITDGTTITSSMLQDYQSIGLDPKDFNLNLSIQDVELPSIDTFTLNQPLEGFDLASITPYDYSSEYEEGDITEEFVGQEEDTTKEEESTEKSDTSLEGELTLPKHTKGKADKKKKSDRKFEMRQTDIAQARAKADITQAVTLEAPTIATPSVELPSLLDYPTEEDPYRYQAIRSV